MSNSIFLGIDGCQTGWVCVELSDKREIKVSIIKSIEAIWKRYSKADIILIDMPIGLVDSGDQPRKTDKAAREFLTRKRSSSVFPIACRSAVYAKNYEEANKINREKTTKGLSKQSWNITPKIRELDIFLRENNKAQKVFIESHPEICLAALNGGEPMNYYKKKEEGYWERINVLKRYFSQIEEFIRSEQAILEKNEADRDDIVDACALAIAASFGQEKLKFIPEDFDYDSEGLPMRMAYPDVLKKE
ncbi:MAG: DUF429 domain-containing protein [Promethearchaeota archaeon]